MNEEKICCACSERKKHREKREKAALLARLHRAQGQLRGIENMLEDDAYCPDLLIQLSAVSKALNALSRQLLVTHVKTCVKSDLEAGKDEAAEELAELLKVLMK